VLRKVHKSSDSTKFLIGDRLCHKTTTKLATPRPFNQAQETTVYFQVNFIFQVAYFKERKSVPLQARGAQSVPRSQGSQIT